jgi:hypothetical protein
MRGLKKCMIWRIKSAGLFQDLTRQKSKPPGYKEQGSIPRSYTGSWLLHSLVYHIIQKYASRIIGSNSKITETEPPEESGRFGSPEFLFSAYLYSRSKALRILSASTGLPFASSTVTLAKTQPPMREGSTPAARRGAARY